MTDIPPPPPGFQIDGQAPEIPAPPAGFALDAPVPTPKPVKSLPALARQGLSALDDYHKAFQRTLINGATFGLSDEASGAADFLGELTKGIAQGKGPSAAARDAAQAYQTQVEAERAKIREFKDENPIVGHGAEFLGGLVSMAPARTAAGTVAPMLSGATVPRAMLQGAKTGALTGGLAGFGSGEGTEGSLTDAAKGATLGTIIGGATPAIANVVGRMGGRVLDALGLRNPENAADRQLLRAFERDQATGGPGPTEAAGKLAANTSGAAVRPEIIPDVAGENVKNLARAATQMPGESRQVAQTILSERAAGQPDRIADDVARLVSPNADYHGTIQALAAKRAADAAPLYDAAFAKGASSPRIDEFLADPVAKEGLQKGLKILRLEAAAEGRPIDWAQMGVEFNQAGDPVLKMKPNMRLLDAAKRGIDDILEQYRDPTTGRLVLDQTGRAIDNFRKAYVNELDSLNPLYAQARAAYAGPSKAQDALAMGRGIFGRDAEVSADVVAKFSPSEKEMFAAGVSRAIADKVDNSADGRNVVASFFGKPAFRDKLRAAFPDQVSFDQFAGLMRRENAMAQAAQIYGPRTGSPTARTLADQADMTVDPPVGVLGNLLRGHIGKAAVAGGEALMRRAQGMTTSTADALASRLFETDPQAMAKILADLNTKRAAVQAGTAQNRALARALLGVTGTEVGLAQD